MVYSKFYKSIMILGVVLWVASAVALVLAWIASTRPTGAALGLPVAHLYWDALVLGVLALGIKASKHHGERSGDCDVCLPGAKKSEE